MAVIADVLVHARQVAARLGVSRQTLRDTGIPDVVLASWYRAL
jgi:hypothetical protein